MTKWTITQGSSKVYEYDGEECTYDFPKNTSTTDLTYVVKVVDNNGCEETKTITVPSGSKCQDCNIRFLTITCKNDKGDYYIHLTSNGACSNIPVTVSLVDSRGGAKSSASATFLSGETTKIIEITHKQVADTYELEYDNYFDYGQLELPDCSDNAGDYCAHVYHYNQYDSIGGLENENRGSSHAIIEKITYKGSTITPTNLQVEVSYVPVNHGTCNFDYSQRYTVNHTSMSYSETFVLDNESGGACSGHHIYISSISFSYNGDNVSIQCGDVYGFNEFCK